MYAHDSPKFFGFLAKVFKETDAQRRLKGRVRSTAVTLQCYPSPVTDGRHMVLSGRPFGSARVARLLLAVLQTNANNYNLWDVASW